MNRICELTLAFIGADIFDYVIYNNRPFQESFLKKNKNASVGESVFVQEKTGEDERMLGRAIARSSIKAKSFADPMAQIRNPFMHDSNKLAKVIMGLL